MYKPSRSKSNPVDRSLSLTHIGLDFSKKIRLDRITRFLTNVLIDHAELKVNWQHNRQGNSSLEIFDPLTQKRHYFQSEQDALVWIEQRYNSRPDETKTNSKEN